MSSIFLYSYHIWTLDKKRDSNKTTKQFQGGIDTFLQKKTLKISNNGRTINVKLFPIRKSDIKNILYKKSKNEKPRKI